MHTILTFATLLALALAQVMSTPTGSSTPFFTNDLVGFLKIAGIFGTMLATMIGLVVKLTQGKYAEQLSALKGQLDGLGARVNDANSNCTRLSEAQRSQELLIRDHSAMHTVMNTAIGEIRSATNEHRAIMENIVRDSTAALTETSRLYSAELAKLQIEVARLQERDKLADSLAQLARARAAEKRDG